MAQIGKEFLEASMETDSPILDDEECLKERKWWCFLLRYIKLRMYQWNIQKNILNLYNNGQIFFSRYQV